MNSKRRWTHWFRLNRKSVLITFLVSYSIIFLIPVALGIVFYLRTEAAMKEQLAKTNQAMLEQLREVLDGSLKEVERLMLQVALNPRVNEYVNRMSTPQKLSAYEYVELKNALQSVKTSSQFIHDFFIYFLDEGVIVTPGTKSDEDLFYQYHYTYPGLSLADWKARLGSGYHYMRYFPAEAVLKNEGRLRMLTVQQSLPFDERTHSRTALLILIDEQIIRNLIMHMEFANLGNIYIVDDQGQIMVSSSDNMTKQTEEMLAGFRNGKTSYYDPVRREEIVLSRTASSRSSWQYISAIPKNAYMGKIIVVKNWALAIVGFGFLIGIAAILYMAKRQYDPVRQLMTVFPQMKFASGENEYHLIRKNLESALHEEKKVRDMLCAQAPLIKANFLSRLLRGQIDAAALDSAARELLDMNHPRGLYAVVVVGVDDIRAFDQRNNEESWAFARFVVANIGLDMIGVRHRGETVEIDRNRLAFLIRLSTESAVEAAAELKRIAEEIRSFLQSRFKLELTIGVGGVRSLLPRIGESYRESLKALDFKIIEGSNSVIHYAELTPSDPSYYYPRELESQLVNAVKSGDTERVEKLIDELMETNFRSQTLTPAMSKYLFFDLISTLIKVMDLFNMKPGAVWKDDLLDPMRLYAECETSERMKRELLRAYSEVCRLLKSDRRPSTLHQAQQIVDYIEKRFADSDLSLITIGEAFGMKPHYVSSFFKKHTGENLADCIARIRIQEAKRLLQQTSMTVTQIAEKVGYANDAGFTRMFKKLEGVTPGKYRELLH